MNLFKRNQRSQPEDKEVTESLQDKMAQFDIEIYRKQLQIGFLQFEIDMLGESFAFCRKLYELRMSA
jgi:hypothetical protein